MNKGKRILSLFPVNYCKHIRCQFTSYVKLPFEVEIKNQYIEGNQLIDEHKWMNDAQTTNVRRWKETLSLERKYLKHVSERDGSIVKTIEI